MNQNAGSGEPGNESNERNQQSRAGRERGEALGIAAGNLTKRRADHQRNGGSNGCGSVTRTAKDPEDEPSEKTRVKTGFRSQVRKGCVAQRRRKQICG